MCKMHIAATGNLNPTFELCKTFKCTNQEVCRQIETKNQLRTTNFHLIMEVKSKFRKIVWFSGNGGMNIDYVLGYNYLTTKDNQLKNETLPQF